MCGASTSVATRVPYGMRLNDDRSARVALATADKSSDGGLVSRPADEENAAEEAVALEFAADDSFGL